ncbi:TPA: beta-N-acetylhexosaminidase [Pasteurella multocida]|uniref:beta-N-acetylhexosaminidase n=1 Tax=Pasteurella multocida TaxID=747 RepID=UPI0007EC4294|nr:beta-N-acetylhexosaminidase [Pasteurella multocida]MCL7788926.1 beta-N-acetylhexosaminidase [Pasteurella multocida]OBP32095.1 beta-N-acetylhexosaminidase [Pasteurella multocida subsp. multocida]PNM07364.1 beta-N-acetylhexosaminidase [Pasteurella multocida]HDR1288068.1 beta-N-acetylhexosaminidase [Pasteurella multocida]HDR1436149.1 beta-N-acetylhexosaminidase [Pasteurella multocida]
MSTLLIDLQGQELSQEEVELLSHPLVAGLILFTRNFHDRAQMQALIQSIRQRVKKPLLITVDQEGGRVQRFREGFTQLPAMQAFACLIDDPVQQTNMAQQAGWQMAAEMTALGIDLSFAPVLDLGHQCQAIGDRSFHSQAEMTLNLASAFIDGMHQVGMAATGKHFPGHGHVIADSHLETPYDERPKQQIFAQDIQPFQQLIQQNMLDAIMPAHVIYSQCDPQPASGSAYWLKQILRQKLGFNGTIFSDDLGMKGAGFMGNFVQRCEQSLQAGCDLLLLCNEREGVIQVLDNLKLSETEPHFALRQQCLQQLFKRKTIRWSELEATSRWLENRKILTALQQRWLDNKANKH